MKILLCNPKNTQGTKHSRKGMYVPLGILSVATYLQENLGDRVQVEVCDEDVEVMEAGQFKDYDLIGFYATTFNYSQALAYAYLAREEGCTTVLGGPHPTVLAENILDSRSCFDYIIRYEAEEPFLQLVAHLLAQGKGKELPDEIPNLAYKREGAVRLNPFHENDLTRLPIPSRDLVPFELYVQNYQNAYPEKRGVRPGSIYSSKGCTWRDRTGGCIFCARLEEGVRFRDIVQIWDEIRMLQERYGINSIWDIADDNLNNREWFKEFVRGRPESCKDLTFFIYSRANCIQPWVMEYFHELNVEEVFIGVESGDNRLLKSSFKGQTRESSFGALKLLNENGIKFYPSFVLGLPGESEASLENTLNLCRDISDLGGLDRISATILKPIPGSPAYDRVLNETLFGRDLTGRDEVDLAFLERYWIQKFTRVSYEKIIEAKEMIDELMGDYHVFGSAVTDQE